MLLDLRNLGSICFKCAYGRTEIHPIWRNWQFYGGVFFPWLWQTGLFALKRKIITRGFTLLLWNNPQEFVCDAWMCEECVPPIPFFRLLGRSGFGDAVGCVEAAASNDIQEITFLGGCLMWNDAAVCGDRIRLNFLWVSGLTRGNPARGNPRWCFLFPWCVVSIGMYCYWRVSIQASGIRNDVIMRSMGQRMPCASSQVRWNYPWMPICVNHVPVVGWSCIWLLLMLGILGGPTWVSHATLKEFPIAMLDHFHCIP